MGKYIPYGSVCFLILHFKYTTRYMVSIIAPYPVYIWIHNPEFVFGESVIVTCEMVSLRGPLHWRTESILAPTKIHWTSQLSLNSMSLGVIFFQNWNHPCVLSFQVFIKISLIHFHFSVKCENHSQRKRKHVYMMTILYLNCKTKMK